MKIIKFIIIVVLGFSFVFSSSKNRFPKRVSHAPLSVDFGHTRENRDENELNAYIEQTMAMNYIPGLSVSIVKNGSIVWGNNYGYANTADSILVNQNTLFLLSSVSKTITATALMQLWEEQYFQLDDPINNYLPFTVSHPDYPNTELTFKMLLTHTSGIKDRWNTMTYYDGDPELELGYFLEEYLISGGEFYNANGNFTNSNPGTNYEYSNIGAALIGYLVEVISEIPFNEYCNENIFEPLEITNAGWFLSEIDIDELAIPYEISGGSGNTCYEIGCGIYDENNPCSCDSECEYYDDCCSDYEDICGEFGTGSGDGTVTLNAINHYGYADYPSGQLRMSAYDLSKITIAYLNNGLYQEIQLLEANTIELIKSIPYPNVDPVQGLIWYYKNESERTLFGHNGGDSGSSTEMFISFSDEIGVIILSNIDNYNALIQIENALFDFAEEITLSALDDLNIEHFSLIQNYPNPFNPVTAIQFSVPKDSYVNLKIFNILGKEVATLISGDVSAGYHKVIWNGRDKTGKPLSSGMYFSRMESGSFSVVKKMVLLK
ncbi:MAG: serine hydrolase [Candidatus Marinimicrobia bacterium]|jgi:CubicO group peptidase (beta-lactamase class C family)|nr:serine hydrolase [Candidatus Neomarinimicrobiota bacterium]MBT3732164.1 serine hydrolase [Candidatus Neomarinimicrobiota bacterium]MBT4178337.1 serine hydrolase [Candidatus Neomarinimicrobiota bacterium]MBT4592914.1 serine hydrolase [Candidatus Neomarinimicrobiota bacterium]MBT4991382.1 serine hydrolase [Candidatus Neomarinimicrobiota bacterium]